MVGKKTQSLTSEVKVVPLEKNMIGYRKGAPEEAGHLELHTSLEGEGRF